MQCSSRRLPYPLIVASLSLGLAACLSPRVALDDAASRVETGSAAPVGGLEAIGSIEAVDGEGCGARGYEGTYEAALVRLKNEAARRAADYVQITGSTPPAFRPGCFDNHFTLTGITYRRPGAAAPTTPVVALPGPPPVRATALPVAPVGPSAPTPASIPPADGPVARKLLELQDLRARNLISPDEYERLRRKVLSDAY